MVQAFNDWLFDPSRKPGDTDIVETEYGYHIMYFSGSQENWMSNVESYILTERTVDMVKKAKERYPMDATYRKVVLGEITF